MQTRKAPPPEGGYFLYHSIGHFPGKAEAMARAFATFAERWAAPDDSQWGYALGVKARFLELWRQVLDVPAGTLTTAESVTAGLYSVIGALPAEHLRGRRVLVAADCFPSLHFLLAGLAPRLGFSLDTVPLRPGAAWVEDEDILARWDEEVGVALLTWVASTSSHRCDIAALAAHGRRMGSLVGVDITQGAGLLPFRAAALPIDFVLSTSLKWLCGTPGAGVLYVRPSLLEACHPEFRGWFSQEDPFAWDLDGFAYAGDARRFDSGTPAIVANVGTVPALEWFLRQEPEALLAHNRALAGRIVEGLAALGLPLASPRAEADRGGSVMARLADADAARRAVACLRAAGVYADARGPVLRLSPGPITTAAGVERLLATLRTLPEVAPR